MRISLRFIPIILFFVFYGLIQLSFTQLRNMEEEEDKRETKAILEIVTDRFKRYLELPNMVGLLGAQQLSSDIHKVNYEKYAELVKKSNPEFLAFNIVDDKGLIFRVFPLESNTKALGRRSQNLGLLLESFEKKEPYYLSQPFRLYQGQQGFIFYIPMVKESRLQGWYAVVISSEGFLEKFALNDFLKVFDLVIIDELSGNDYFATSIGPKDEHTKVFSRHETLFGRKMYFKTWRKDETPIHSYPWYFSVAISLSLAAASWFMISLYEQRRRASGQLKNISMLLRVTSKEALSNLIEIHSEFNQLNLPDGERLERLSRDINYLTNLIEQIDLLQTMAHNREGFSKGSHSFVQLFRAQLENFSDVLLRKNIKIELNEKEFQDVQIRMNEWLFCNSVLSNVLSHLLIHIEPNSRLKLETQSRGQRQSIAFRIKNRPVPDQSPKLVTRRIEVAKKFLQLQLGDLREEMNGDELVITMYLPQ